MKMTERDAKKSRDISKQSRKTTPSKVDTKDNLMSDDYLQVIHDLQVHQIELARQNEELRDIQLKLEESRAQYVELYDHAPVGYFTFDDKGEILAVNLTGSLKLGREKEILLNKPFPSFMSQDDSDLFYLHLKKVFDTGSQQSCDLTLFRKNGGSFYAQLDSIAAAGGVGERPRCQTTITNISQRKVLEDALQFTETRYRRLFEAARDGVLILDAETGQIADANPYIMEMLGYTYQEFLGKKLWEIGCFADTTASKEALASLRSKGYARYDNLPLQTKNGRKIAVEFISSAYLVNGRKVIQCNIRDVSERLLLESLPPIAHDGSERRTAERRVQTRQMSEHAEQKNKEHQQSEESLLIALQEIKALKDRLVVENIFFRQEGDRKETPIRPYHRPKRWPEICALPRRAGGADQYHGPHPR